MWDVRLEDCGNNKYIMRSGDVVDGWTELELRVGGTTEGRGLVIWGSRFKGENKKVEEDHVGRTLLGGLQLRGKD